jgi:hypothetical protein
MLVIKDVSLWLSLSRIFTGSRSVQLGDAPSWKLGLTLARVERPDLVVCSAESLGLPAEVLEREVRAENIEGVSFVCVDSELEPGTAASLGEGFSVCAPDRFPSIVCELIDMSSESGLGAAVELLAHFECQSGPEGADRRGFANILELSQTELLMECDHGLETGDVLKLSFFLPGPASEDSARIPVSMLCLIRRVHDEGKLIYTADIRELDETSESAISQFVGDDSRVGES